MYKQNGIEGVGQKDYNYNNQRTYNETKQRKLATRNKY